jgi:hypothetical protein
VPAGTSDIPEVPTLAVVSGVVAFAGAGTGIGVAGVLRRGDTPEGGGPWLPPAALPIGPGVTTGTAGGGTLGTRAVGSQSDSRAITAECSRGVTGAEEALRRGTCGVRR